MAEPFKGGGNADKLILARLRAGRPSPVRAFVKITAANGKAKRASL